MSFVIIIERLFWFLLFWDYDSAVDLYLYIQPLTLDQYGLLAVHLFIAVEKSLLDRMYNSNLPSIYLVSI